MCGKEEEEARDKDVLPQTLLLIYCFLESMYHNNLILEMMVVYVHGNLAHVIKTHHQNNKDTITTFTTLCNNDAIYSKGDSHKIMKYVGFSKPT